MKKLMALCTAWGRGFAVLSSIALLLLVFPTPQEWADPEQPTGAWSWSCAALMVQWQPPERQFKRCAPQARTLHPSDKPQHTSPSTALEARASGALPLLGLFPRH